MTFASHYGNLVAKIMSEEGEQDFNQRTNSKINFLPEGYSFSIDLNGSMLPTCGLRRTRPHIAAAEVAWCFMGATSLSWLQKHTSIWNQFADDDGNVMEAYGYRWKEAFGYDQLGMAIMRLIADTSDRRVWISSWDPRCDLVARKQKTVPCPVGFTLSVSGNRLNSSLMIRSSDVFIGLPLDVMRHALVMKAIACSLKMTPGHMRVTLAHPHIYESHWDMALEMLEQEEFRIPEIQMPDWDVNQIAFNPDEYVRNMRNHCLAADNWPDYDPRVQVVK